MAVEKVNTQIQLVTEYINIYIYIYYNNNNNKEWAFHSNLELFTPYEVYYELYCNSVCEYVTLGYQKINQNAGSASPLPVALAADTCL
jgi:hypothetical protein